MMEKRSELYMISEPQAPAAPEVVPKDAATAGAPPRPGEYSWRELMRRLQKSQAQHKPSP